MLLPLAQREQHRFLQVYKDPECLVQVLVGKFLSSVSDHHTVWVVLVDTIELRQKCCRRTKQIIRRTSLVIFHEICIAKI